MQQTPYYNSTIKNLTVAFGNLFTGITIVRTGTGAASGVTQTVAVPLSYSNKEKWVQRVQEQPNADVESLYMTLPRLAFQITNLSYNQSLKIPRLNQMATNSVQGAYYTGVPYTVSFSLYVLSANQEDGLQIIEQILPAFAPEYPVTINGGPSGSTNTQQVPIVLTGVSSQDEFEGSLSSRRLVTWTLNFNANVMLYGPSRPIGIIKQVNVYINDPNHPAGTMPTGENLPVADYAASQSTPTSPIIESWIEQI
jgi:hypothetical protein